MSTTWVYRPPPRRAQKRRLGVPAVPAPVLRRVLTKTGTIAEGTGTLAFDLVDPPDAAMVTSKAFAVATAYPSLANPARAQVATQVVDTDTFDVVRSSVSTPAPDITVRAQLAEWDSGVLVQRGNQDMANLETVDITLPSAVDPARTFVILSQRTVGTNWGRWRLLTGRLVDATTLRIDRYLGASSTATVVAWQVVEHAGCRVRSGTVELTSETSKTVTIPTVDPAKTLLIVNHTATSDGTTPSSQFLPKGEITDATTLTFTRDASGVSVSIDWQVVEFFDGTTVQRGKLDFAGESSKTATLVGATTASSIALAAGFNGRSGTTAWTGDQDSSTATFELEITSATQLTVRRGATGANASVTWQVVTFPASTQAYPRSADDAPTIADAATRMVAFVRTGADGITAADAATRVLALPRATPDAVTASEVATRVLSLPRTASEAVSAAETLTRAQTLARALGDATAALDAVARTYMAMRAASEAAAAVETLARAMTVARALADTPTTADAATRVLSLPRTTAEAVSASEATHSPVTHNRAVDEVLLARNRLSANQASVETDLTGLEVQVNCTLARSTAQAAHGTASLRMTSLAAGVMRARTPTGSTAVLFAVTAGQTYTAFASFRAESQAQNVRVVIDWRDGDRALLSSSAGEVVLDSASSWVESRAVALAPAGAAYCNVTATINNTAAGGEVHYVDKLGLYDGLATQWNPPQDNASDVAARVFTGARSLGDSAAAADQASRAASLPRAVTDQAGVSDQVVVAQVLARALAEAVTTTDAATRVLSLPRTATDGAATADDPSRVLAYLRALVDGSMAADASLRAQVLARALAEAVIVTDVAGRLLSVVRSAADVLTVSDQAQGQLIIFAIAQDTIVVGDTPARAAQTGRALTDGVALADIAARVWSGARTGDDGTNVSDTLARLSIMARVPAETVVGLDAAARALGLPRTISEAISASDAPARVWAGQRTLTEAATASEAAARMLTLLRAAADTMSAVDTPARLLGRIRGAADAVAVLDTAVRLLAITRSPTDNAAISEQLLVSLLAFIRYLGGQAPVKVVDQELAVHVGGGFYERV